MISGTEIATVRIARRFRAPLHYEMEIPVNDHISRPLRAGRPYELRVLRAILRLRLRPGHFLDVGAHLGNHSVYLGLCGWKVSSVEPNQELFRLLHRNISLNGLLRHGWPRQVAVGEVAGRARQSGTVSGNSGMTTFEQHPNGEVEIVTIDSLDISPDVIKIDVEGAELQVLSGGVQTLARFKPALVIEILDKAAHQEVERVLLPLGYRQVGGSLAGAPTYLFTSRTSQTVLARLWAAVENVSTLLRRAEVHAKRRFRV